MAIPRAIVSLLSMVALGGWLGVVWFSWRAWQAAENHPPYRALGVSRYVNWMGSLRHMPAESGPYLRNAGRSAMVFAAAVATIMLLNLLVLALT